MIDWIYQYSWEEESTMNQQLDTLFYEVFVQEERCRAELRLSAEEAAFLQSNRGAQCTPLSQQDDRGGKRWYLVQLK